MSSIKIHDLDKENDYFVGTCGHINESEEIDNCAKSRLFWFKNRHDDGAKAKVAYLNGKPMGFAYMMPIEVSPWGPLGQGCNIIPCLYVPEEAHNLGIGRELLTSLEKDAKEDGATGVVTIGYFHDHWFMPAQYFIKNEYESLVKRQCEVVLGKQYNDSFSIPRLLTPNYHFNDIEGKLVVDLFWNSFCETSVIEANRVRNVCKEFGRDVRLNEYLSDIRYVLERYQIPRGIFINGCEYNWGCEAPYAELKNTIALELENIK